MFAVTIGSRIRFRTRRGASGQTRTRMRRGGVLGGVLGKALKGTHDGALGWAIGEVFDADIAQRHSN